MEVLNSRVLLLHLDPPCDGCHYELQCTDTLLRHYLNPGENGAGSAHQLSGLEHRADVCDC